MNKYLHQKYRFDIWLFVTWKTEEYGYKSNLLKNYTFHSLISTFCPPLIGSIQARNQQFRPLQNIEDLRMHYTIGVLEHYGK
jgi:hypothetical protein